MSKKTSKLVHASRQGTKRPLCSKRQGRTTNLPEDVTCFDCARVAQRLLERLLEQERASAPDVAIGRQEAALASRQPSRWWVKDQREVKP